jgi:peptide/nickel transport system substrate-binding protein
MSSRGLAPLVSSVETPNELTVVVEWSRTYPFANAIVRDDLGPMPAHLLEAVYQADKERFVQLPYWTRECGGVGPYRLAEWEAGSHLTLRAYERFYAGRAKIDTLVFRFIASAPAAVANLLAGSIDGAIPRTLDFTQVMFVKEEWERAGRKPVALIQPTHWRILEPQFRDPSVSEILDVRFRRALLHAIDRQGMVDTLLAGTIPVSDTFIPPHDLKWDWVKDVVVRYEYDPGRARQLLGEVGWRRGPDGSFLNASGERAVIPLATSQGEQAEQEQAIIAASWRDIGLGVDQHVRTAAEARENRLNSIFPGFSASALPLTFENTSMRLHSVSCPTDPRWVGPNHGCYRIAEMDRIIDNLQGAIDPSEQRRLYRELVKWQTEELPAYPLYFNPQALILREGVTGVKGDTNPRTAPTWNVAEWDVR